MICSERRNTENLEEEGKMTKAGKHIRFTILPSPYSSGIPVWDILDDNGNIIVTALRLRDAWEYYKNHIAN